MRIRTRGEELRNPLAVPPRIVRRRLCGTSLGRRSDAPTRHHRPAVPHAGTPPRLRRGNAPASLLHQTTLSGGTRPRSAGDASTVGGRTLQAPGFHLGRGPAPASPGSLPPAQAAPVRSSAQGKASTGGRGCQSGCGGVPGGHGAAASPSGCRRSGSRGNPDERRGVRAGEREAPRAPDREEARPHGDPPGGRRAASLAAAPLCGGGCRAPGGGARPGRPAGSGPRAVRSRSAGAPPRDGPPRNDPGGGGQREALSPYSNPLWRRRRSRA